MINKATETLQKLFIIYRIYFLFWFICIILQESAVSRICRTGMDNQSIIHVTCENAHCGKRQKTKAFMCVHFP